MGTFSSAKWGGTDVSGAHIGDTSSKRLAGLLADSGVTPSLFSVSVSAEVANEIIVSIQLTDANYDILARAQDYKAYILDADGIQALAADWIMAESGDGTEISNTAQATLLVQMSTGGASELTVGDVSAAYAGDVYLVLEPLGLGAPALVTLTFA